MLPLSSPLLSLALPTQRLCDLPLAFREAEFVPVISGGVQDCNAVAPPPSPGAGHERQGGGGERRTGSREVASPSVTCAGLLLPRTLSPADWVRGREGPWRKGPHAAGQ